MYAEHFGLHRKPFQAPHDECSFFTSESVSAVVPSLLHAMRSDLGVAVVTGPAGVGKTATLRHLQRMLAADGKSLLLTSGAMQSTHGLFASLYRGISAGVDDDGIAASASPVNVERWQVIDRLRQLSQFWGPFLLLIDDAHNLPTEIFHELRSLLEEEHAGHSLLRLLVGGSLTLEEVLAKPALAGFGHKIRTHVFLESLRQSEAIEFLTTQLSNVGGQLPEMMEPSAVERIVVAADGYPRLLCLLADEALIIAAAQSLAKVSLATVDEALGRLQHLPYAWNATPNRYECSDDEEIDPDRLDDGESLRSDSDGVIEFGAPSEQAGTQSSNGVIEIGAPDDYSHTDAVIEIATEPKDFDSTEHHIAPSTVETMNTSESIIEEEAAFETCSSEPVSVEVGDASVGDDSLSGLLNPPELLRTLAEPEGVALAESEGVDADHTNLQSDAADDEIEAFTEDSQQDAAVAFELWQPPGEWQQVRTPSAESTTPWFKRPLMADATAVFDRYTWNELGREVPSGDSNPNVLVSDIKEKVVWPPRQHGIVPDDTISVQFVSNGEETLPEEFHACSSDKRDQQIPDEANQQDILSSAETTPASASLAIQGRTNQSNAADGWVDGQLLGDELKKEISGRQQTTVPGIDSHDIVSLPITKNAVQDMASSATEDDPPTSFATAKRNSDSQRQVKHVHVSDDTLFTLPISVADVKAQTPAENRTPRPTSAEEVLFDTPHDHGQSQPAAMASGSQTQEFGVKNRIDSVGDASEAATAYAPRLLLLARARVGVSAARQMKTAAGAENLTATDSSEQRVASASTQRTPSLRSEAVCGNDGKSAVPLDLLFTKLRQMGQE